MINLNSLQELVNSGANVIVVTRPGSSSKLPTGIKVATADITDVKSLAKILKDNKIEVVVSTVGHPALPNQHLLGDAAKEAGVQLFVLSEFGYSTVGRGGTGELGLKAKCAEHLQEIGLPSLRIFVSGKSRWIILEMLSLTIYS